MHVFSNYEHNLCDELFDLVRNNVSLLDETKWIVTLSGLVSHHNHNPSSPTVEIIARICC